MQTRVVDVAVLFSTDPAVGADALVELVDDRGLQPAENVTPVVRTETLAAFGPSLGARLDEVSAQLTTEDLRALNAELAAGRSPRSVAKRWLRTETLG